MDAAFEFGRYLSVAEQCAEDIKTFQNSKSILKPTNIILILALIQSEKIRICYKNYTEDMNITNSNQLKDNIMVCCEGIVAEAKLLCQNYVKRCTSIIQAFQHKDSVKAIEDILSTILDTLPCD